MKKITLILLSVTSCLVVFISCIPVFDSMEQMRIVNNSADTILIGNADYSNIDSVKWFLDHYRAKYDSTCTGIDSTGSLIISKNNLIPHDSMDCYGETVLFGHNREHKGYFFIIKLETAKNYSWKEICRDKLYDTLVVTRDMLKQGNIIEYKGENNGEKKYYYCNCCSCIGAYSSRSSSIS